MSVKLRLQRLEDSQKAKADEVSYWMRVNAEAGEWITQQVILRAEHEQFKKQSATAGIQKRP
jgi:hypothetical protein